MTRAMLLNKLDALLTTAEAEKMWGNVEIEIRGGQPTVLRKLTTERLTPERDTSHAQQQPEFRSR